MKLLRFIFIFIIFLQLIDQAFAISSDQSNHFKETIDWGATDLNGQSVSLEEMLVYPKVILLFWTTRCPRCEDDLKILNKRCSYFDDVKIFLVNIAESKRSVEQFISYNNLNQCMIDSVVLDKEAKIKRSFYIPGVPTYIFFDNGVPIYISYFWNDYLLGEVYGNE